MYNNLENKRSHTIDNKVGWTDPNLKDICSMRELPISSLEN